MKKLKVMTIVGTRPELIKLSRVIAELDKTIEHVLVHTGQNYDDELSYLYLYYAIFYLRRNQIQLFPYMR